MKAAGYKYSWCHTKGKIGGARPANPSLGMTMTSTRSLKTLFCSTFLNTCQRRANPNPDLDLNRDLASFPNSVDLDLKIFDLVNLDLDLDLTFSKVVDLDLDLNIAGFGFEDFKSTNPLYIYIKVNKLTKK